MSLASLGLRLAILNAFAPEGATTFPTLAGNAYHDSLLDPLSITHLHPQVVFMVEEVNGQAPGPQNSGRRLQPKATLIFILTIYVRMEGEGEEGFVAVQTDHQAADMLDILTDQIRLVLLENQTVSRFASRLFTTFHTENFEDEAGVKYARRALTIGCDLVEDATAPLTALVAALPTGERKARGQAALAALAQTTALLEGAPPPPLVVENSILEVFRQDGTTPPDGDTTNQIVFSPMPAS